MALRSSARWVQAGIVSLFLGIVAGLWIAPNSLRANEDARFFAATGHNLTNEYGFLTYWRDHNGDYLFGAPVTEVVNEAGLPVQYFERGRLELHTELEGAPVLPGRVGAEYAAALWRVFDAPTPRAPMPGEQFFAETGQTLRDPFLRFWNDNGGLAAFGYPISEPLWEYVGSQVVRVQYFERVRLEQHPLAAGTPAEVQISSLGRDLALIRGHDTAPLEVPVAEPAPAQAAPAAPAPEVPAVPVPEVPAAPAPAAPAPAAPAPAAPAPAAPAPAASPAGKRIVVNLSAQWLYAYEGDTIVFDAPVSTGKDGFNTPPGSFAVYAKVPSQTMSGTIGGEYYNVPNVPDVMYINGGVALHGTYWHNMFGTGVRVSHGCINLPLGSAAWLYNWAPLGTPVQVTY